MGHRFHTRSPRSGWSDPHVCSWSGRHVTSVDGSLFCLTFSRQKQNTRSSETGPVRPIGPSILVSKYGPECTRMPSGHPERYRVHRRDGVSKSKSPRHVRTLRWKICLRVHSSDDDQVADRFEILGGTCDVGSGDTQSPKRCLPLQTVGRRTYDDEGILWL